MTWIQIIADIYLSEFAFGLYVGLGIGLICMMLLDQKVRALLRSKYPGKD